MRGVSCLALLIFSGCVGESVRPRSRDRVLEEILPAPVRISVEQDGDRFRSASGVVIDARAAVDGTDCFVLTSGHTLTGVAAPQQIFVVLDRTRGQKIKVPARVLARRDSPDLALLTTRTSECAAARLGRPPALGDAIWVLAFPWDHELTLVAGVVSQLNGETPDEGESPARLMVDAPVSYGASGGGVFDTRTGRLVGLVMGYQTARVRFPGDTTGRYLELPVPGETYVIPLVDIRRFLTESGYGSLLGSAMAKPR